MSVGEFIGNFCLFTIYLFIFLFVERPCYTGKDNKSIWYMYPPPINTRTRRHNLVSERPGPKGIARNACTAIQSWVLFFPDKI